MHKQSIFLKQNKEGEDAQLLGTGLVNMEVLKNDLNSCSHCHAGESNFVGLLIAGEK